jgi:lysyl-tRNA synthetase class 2
LDRSDELRRVRLEKLAALREMGLNPYPHTFHTTIAAREILERFSELDEKGHVTIAGRLMSLREMGKASFAHLQDGSGRIQVYFKRDQLPEGSYEIMKLLDLGDLIGVEGVPFRTRTGEITVRAERLTVLCKGLRPLPIVKEKDGQRYDDLSDKDIRYRQRHADLLLNPSTRRTLEMRTAVIRALRGYLDSHGFLEVETPILQTIYGGAYARPFLTRHNALSIDLFMRIALELPLKRLLVGGIEKVYEIGRVFRNEGMDREHNPEFTMLEFYWAYADYIDAMNTVEDLLRAAARATLGGTSLSWNGVDLDLANPFHRVTMRDLLREHAGLDIVSDPDERFDSWLRARGERGPLIPGRGPLIESCFDLAVVPRLREPTFVMDYPRTLSPLAKAHREHPEDLVERFELFIAGKEFANAFSELNDPVDQRARLEEQARRRAMGDEEAQQLDEDFMIAIEHGMPPAAGVGIGVDRLVMLLTGEPNIRDVLFFPLMKPEGAGPRDEGGDTPGDREGALG